MHALRWQGHKRLDHAAVPAAHIGSYPGADLDSGLRRNDEWVGLAVGGFRAGGVGAGTEMRKGTDLPARYAGTEAENGHQPSSPSYRRRPVPSAARDEAADAVCPDRRVLRRWAWVLDSGLRRNDEWVGLAVGGLGAGQRRSVADRRATGGRAIRRLFRRSERGRDDRRPLPDGRGRRFHAMTSGRAKRSCRVPLGQRRGRRRCGAAPSRV